MTIRCLVVTLAASATLLGTASAATACPADNGSAPSDIKSHFCGAWNSAPAGTLGYPLNDAHRWGAGWIRDVDGGSWARGAILEGDGGGFAYVIAEDWWPAFVSPGNDSSGGPTLGYPTGSAVFGGHIHTGTNANQYMTLQHGVINKWAGGTFETHGAIMDRWNAACDARGCNVSGPVGRPLSNEQDTARVTGRYEKFEGGNIIYNPAVDGAFLVYGGMLTKYGQLGYSNHPLGLPTSDRRHNDAKGNDYQTFDGGVINQYGGHAYETHGAIWAKWNGLGGATGPVGLPTSDEQQTARVDGRYETFEGGNLIYNPATGKTWLVYGGILNKYRSVGYSQSALGLPTNDRQHNPYRGNDYQTFQGGVINQYGGQAYISQGAILATWNARGGANGPIGLPTSDEGVTARVPGRFQSFQGGNLIYSQQSGQTYLVYGGILNKYRELGYSNHPLGLPTSDRKHNDRYGNDYQTFQGGVINQYGGQAYETHGAILARWNRSGGIGGPLGLPKSDESPTAISPHGSGGRYERFQRGIINYNQRLDRAFVLFGSIGSKYASLGYSGSYLGLPTSEEHDLAGGGKRQDFEGGYIAYRGGVAKTDRELSKRPRYVIRVLGDSISAGFGLRSSVFDGMRCASRFPTSACDYPAGSWGSFVAKHLQNRQLRDRAVDYANLSVSGSKTSDWLSGGDNRGDVTNFRQRLNSIVASRPDLLMLTLGANDLLADKTCSRDPYCVGKLIAAAHTNLKALLRSLAARTHARIYVLLYYRIEGDRVEAVRILNDAIKDAVRSAGARVKYVVPPSFSGHGCHDHRLGSWMLGWDGDFHASYTDGCLHPNGQGILAIAQSVEDTIARYGL